MKKYQDLILGLAMITSFYICAFASSYERKVDCKTINAQMEQHGIQKYEDAFKGTELKTIKKQCGGK